MMMELREAVDLWNRSRFSVNRDAVVDVVDVVDDVAARRIGVASLPPLLRPFLFSQCAHTLLSLVLWKEDC